MSYDNSSITGDEICEYYYDIENNYMNPPSPTGFFMYKIIGGCFDWINDLISQFRNDYSILDCNVGNVELVPGLPDEPDTGHIYYVPNYTTSGGNFTKYTYANDTWSSETVTGDIINSLDIFWGRSYNLTRPVLTYASSGDTYSRRLTDEEYKIYLYLMNHQLLTMKDLLVAFTNAFGGAEHTKTELDVTHMVNHKKYDNPAFSNASLMAYDNSDEEIAVDSLIDPDDVSIVIDRKTEGSIITIIIPDAETYDPYYLSFLETFISIKGNVLIGGA